MSRKYADAAKARGHGYDVFWEAQSASGMVGSAVLLNKIVQDLQCDDEGKDYSKVS